MSVTLPSAAVHGLFHIAIKTSDQWLVLGVGTLMAASGFLLGRWQGPVRAPFIRKPRSR
jgi:hypothetical protein